MILVVDALVRAGGGALLLEFFADGTVELFFEDGLSLDGLELGLEVLQLMGRRVTAAACIVHVVGHVFDFVTISAPGMESVLRCQCLHDDTAIKIERVDESTYQLPFPLPSFLVLVGSVSA